MKNNDTVYDDYRQSESDWAEQLEEKRRACEDAVEWEEFRQSMPADRLDIIDSGIRRIRRLTIRIERKGGRSIREARLEADALIAKVRKAILTPTTGVAARTP